ncbi:MAG: lytic murein transglycosylase [Gammaproteobacteria bacterium]|nr:lytic murein transglycosylase [Gammaproteobacteria bacterium]
MNCFKWMTASAILLSGCASTQNPTPPTAPKVTMRTAVEFGTDGVKVSPSIELTKVLVPANSASSALPSEVNAFINRAAGSDAAKAQRMRSVLSRANTIDRVLSLSGAKAEAKGEKPKAIPTRDYLPRFLSEPRPTQGREFGSQYRDALNRATATYGVPQSIILAIIGVETAYGRITGNFKTVDALYTLGFNFPRRAEFFQSELAKVFELERKAGIDVEQLYGSFAGAIGYPQFMPSSYLAYAVDHNGDGRIDLLNDPVDAIGSVAAYLSAHGWKPGEAAISQQPMSDKRFSAEETGMADDWYAAANFNVIKRYNNSDKYALAVGLLAERFRVFNQ